MKTLEQFVTNAFKKHDSISVYSHNIRSIHIFACKLMSQLINLYPKGSQSLILEKGTSVYKTLKSNDEVI